MSNDPNIPLLFDKQFHSDDDRYIDEDDLIGLTRQAQVRFRSAEAQKALHNVERYGGKGAVMGASLAISHAVPFLGGVLTNLLKERAAAQCVTRLDALRHEDCPLKDKQPHCDGILAYTLCQKEAGKFKHEMEAIPLVSDVVAGTGILNWLRKRWKGTAGVQRAAQAKLLVEHARGGCWIAAAIFVEITCGNFTEKKNWNAGLEKLHGPISEYVAKDGLDKS